MRDLLYSPPDDYISFCFVSIQLSSVQFIPLPPVSSLIREVSVWETDIQQSLRIQRYPDRTWMTRQGENTHEIMYNT